MPGPPRQMIVCALAASFLDGICSNFGWRCIMGKSSCLFLYGAALSVPFFIG